MPRLEVKDIIIATSLLLDYNKSQEVEGVPTTQTGAVLHIAARQSPYFGTNKKRFPVFDKYVPWRVLFVEYDPPRYTAPMEYFSEWFRQFADEVDPRRVLFVEYDPPRYTAPMEYFSEWFRQLAEEVDPRRVLFVEYDPPRYTAPMEYFSEWFRQFADEVNPRRVLFVEYDPPRYTAPMEYFSEWFRQFADEVDPRTQKPAPVWNEVVGYKMKIWHEGEGGKREELEEVMEVDRRSWIEDKNTGVGIRYNITSEGVPQNPMGRTGLRGKGALFRWGPNHSMLAICTRWKRSVDPATGDEQEEYLLVEGKRVLEFLSYKEPDFEEWAIPGVMTAGLESKYSVLYRVFCTKALGKQPAVVDRHMDESKVKQLFEAYAADERDCPPSDRDDPIETFSAAMIYRGYVDDPRNTDGAWVETEAWHFHYESGEVFLEGEMVTAGSRWQEVSRHVKLFASHASVIQEAAARLNAYF
ncbi:NUDT9 [Branchiostoma lanceolatum]|uniref:NUDT9 protein n=1 Tax=Branchiostoma lanceolatum TaxID=7740 RepID=A0A8K0F2P5_BRALA|nr:NUDT9 [Branchiostoma lanceolatum]